MLLPRSPYRIAASSATTTVALRSPARTNLPHLTCNSAVELSPAQRRTMTRSQTPTTNTNKPFNPDLYNDHLLRQPNATDTAFLTPDPAYDNLTLAIPESEDNPTIRAKYRPFLLPDEVESSDWISKVELSTALKLSAAAIRPPSNDVERPGQAQNRLKVLVLYGSLRARSYSRLLAYEYARILWRLGCDVRVFNPEGLPVKDDVQHGHEKVQELRELSTWSEGHVWVSPEQHGNLTAVFKNQIDWIPLSTGSVRPTQGRTLAIAQVSGGSQSFNSVNSLRILGRWMRMYVIPNQSSVPKAYEQFTDAVQTSDMDEIVDAEGGSRMLPSGNRDRVVDCVEEFVKMSLVMRDWSGVWSDRYSERKQKREKQEKEEREKKEREKNELGKTSEERDVLNGVNVNGL